MRISDWRSDVCSSDLARAVAPMPDILSADEPTGNLDGGTSSAIIDLLFARRAVNDATLFIITHDTALAERSDRIEIGRAPCRDSGCQYVSISGCAVSHKTYTYIKHRPLKSLHK